MITKELIGKIQSLMNHQHKFLFEIQYTKKFHDKNFDYEIKDSLFEEYSWDRDSYNNLIVKDGPQVFYKEIKSKQDPNQNIIMLIKGSPLDFYDQKNGTYKNLNFSYNTFVVDEFEFVCLYDITFEGDVFEIPDELDGIPVLYVYFDSLLNFDSVKKFIIGNNLISFKSNKDRFFPKMKNLDKIVINQYNFTGNNLSKFLYYYWNESVNIDMKKCTNFKIINGFLVSSDEKEMFLILNKNDVVEIPENVEHIHARSFNLIENDSLKIEWPKNLKIMDASLGLFCFKENPLPDTIEVLNNSVISEYCNLWEKIFTIPKNIKEISIYSEVWDSYDGYIIINNSDNYYSDGKYLLTNDKKTLICYISNKRKKIILPETIENIDNEAYISRMVEKIILKRNDEKLIKQIEDYNKKHGYKHTNRNIEVITPVSNDEQSSKTSEKPDYNNVKDKCYITNNVKTDKLMIDISKFTNTKKKIFVLTKECANIKELILPEGVTEIEVDNSCYSVDFNLEILEIPSSCKFSNILESLELLDSFMMLIINPIKKPKWDIHNLSYVVACKSDFSMPKGVIIDYGTYDSGYSSINEITYIKNFERDKLIITDDAYYYINNISKKEAGLLKVRKVSNYSLPKNIDDYKIKKNFNYCYSKYNFLLDKK